MPNKLFNSPICILLFCLSGIQAFSQIDPKVTSSNDQSSILSFSDFLKTLPDSTASTINELQHRLAQTQDELDQIQANLLDKKAKTEESEPSDKNEQVLTDLENIGYLNQEMVSLTRALLNLQSSSEIEFELAYLEESKQLIELEVEKFTKIQPINISNKAETEVKPTQNLVKEAVEDLDNYDFEVHPQTDVKGYPEFECEIIAGTAKTTNQAKYTKLSPFFSFTPKKLKEHFQESAFITCNAQLAKTDKLYFINLEIQIQTKTARDTYGGIDKAAALRLELINGDKLLAYNVKRDYGTLSADEESVIYNVIYSLDSDDIKSLSKLDLDKIGIIWSTGYEDYEVFQTDFILNHINCLNN